MTWTMIKRAAKKFILLVQATRKTEEEAIVNAFMAGVAWHEEKVWVRVSDRLPEIDRDVIVFNTFPNANGKTCYQLCFAHRVDKSRKVMVDGKEYEPEAYDKGGWSIGGVKYWLDLKLPMDK